ERTGLRDAGGAADLGHRSPALPDAGALGLPGHPGGADQRGEARAGRPRHGRPGRLGPGGPPRGHRRRRTSRGPGGRRRARGRPGPGPRDRRDAGADRRVRRLAGRRAAPRSRLSRPRRGPGRGCGVTTSVLVVDDQALLRTAFSSLIDAEDDLDVLGEAADGRQAVERAASLAPDVVVMDVRMPVMDGIEATRQITSGPGEGGPRVLILTTFDLD